MINTFTIDPETSTRADSEDSNKDRNNGEENETVRKNKRRKLNANDTIKSFLKDTFEKRMQYEKERDREEQDREEKRWREQVELEKAKIEAIKELTIYLKTDKTE